MAPSSTERDELFKGFARALDAATQRDPRVRGIPSTKGTLLG